MTENNNKTQYMWSQKATEGEYSLWSGKLGEDSWRVELRIDCKGQSGIYQMRKGRDGCLLQIFWGSLVQLNLTEGGSSTNTSTLKCPSPLARFLCPPRSQAYQWREVQWPLYTVQIVCVFVFHNHIPIVLCTYTNVYNMYMLYICYANHIT